jgi:molybdenum cofactor biosynthesis enzyme MoaA
VTCRRMITKHKTRRGIFSINLHCNIKCTFCFDPCISDVKQKAINDLSHEEEIHFVLPLRIASSGHSAELRSEVKNTNI